MTEWTIGRLQALCTQRDWVLDTKPDPDRGLYAVPPGGAEIRITLTDGAQIVAQSSRGLISGCLPTIGAALDELLVFVE